jgi:hypothetical protein
VRGAKGVNVRDYDRLKQNVRKPEEYLAIQGFMRRLNKHVKALTRQEYTALRGQALSGDLEAAEKGFAKILERMEGF